MHNKALFSSIKSTIIFRNGICRLWSQFAFIVAGYTGTHTNISGPGTYIQNKLIQGHFIK